MPATDTPSAESGLRRAATILTVFATVFFLRLWLVREWGSGIPFWDQWDAEALQLYRPWLDGSFRWSSLFHAHNEHRIVLTRLIDLILFVGTSHWETWWLLVINAALNAATAALLVRAFWETLTSGFRLVFLGLLAALFTTPSGWQNALWGFQSQCYLVNGLSCLAVVALLTGEPLRPRWWAGWVAALLAVFSQASGVLAPAAALAVGGLGLFSRCELGRRKWIATALLAALLMSGFLLGVRVAGHSYLETQTVAQFFAVFTRCLAYPLIEQPLFALPLQLPALWLLASLVRQRRAPSPHEGLALGLALVGALNGAAIAYSRGAGLVDCLPISRYQDGLLIGAIGNTAALLGLCARHRRGSAVVAVWTGLLLLGLVLLGAGSLTFNLRFKEQQNHTAQAMLAAYRETRDPAVFETEPPFLRPHPEPRSVIAVLDDPLLAPILPPECSGSAPQAPWLVGFSPWFALASTAALTGLLALGLVISHRVENPEHV